MALDTLGGGVGSSFGKREKCHSLAPEGSLQPSRMALPCGLYTVIVVLVRRTDK